MPSKKNRPAKSGRPVTLLTKLTVIQLCVEPILFHQLAMIALLDDRAVFHHQDHIRRADGRQPVGNDKAGSALHHPSEGILDLQFRTGIDGGGGLVQDQHGG